MVADRIVVGKAEFRGVEDMVGFLQNADLTGVQLRSGVPRGRMLYASADGFEFSTGNYTAADIRSVGVLHPHRVSLGGQTSPDV